MGGWARWQRWTRTTRALFLTAVLLIVSGATWRLIDVHRGNQDVRQCIARELVRHPSVATRRFLVADAESGAFADIVAFCNDR